MAGPDARILALSGFMGSGKSTVGKLLAGITCRDFIDLDEYIVESSGMEIPEIFSLHGEEGFRKLEAGALKDVISKYGSRTGPGPVLALGGGTLTVPESRDLVKENCINVYLRATCGTLMTNLKGGQEGRPMLQTPEEAGEAVAREQRLLSRIEELMAERGPVYEKSADYIIAVGGKDPERIAREIAELVR